MESMQIPEKENPRYLANVLSRLFFFWTIPVLYRGSQQGMSREDLIKCLPEDQSKILGDELEKNWLKEIQISQQKKRQPLLRNAVLRTFWRPAILDGFICLVYITIKTLIPVVLAQLLVHFQITFRNESNSNDADNMLLNSTVRNLTLLNALPNDEILYKSTKSKIDAFNISTDDSDSITGNNLDAFVNIINDMWNNVYCLGGILVGSTLFGCFLIHHVDLRQRLLGARMRIACCSLIYRKTITLSAKCAGETPAGYLVNLLSNDVGRLDYGFIFIHWIWILPIQAVLVCYLIWTRIGLAAVVGVVGLLVKTIPVQTGLSRWASKLRLKIAERTDARIGIMHELVQGIQVIKMYAWEKPFQAIVKKNRQREIKQVRYASYVRGFYLSTMVFTERSTLYITIAAAVLLGSTISADIVFSIAGYYNILQLVAAIWYPLAVSFGAEALVSLKRLQTFLLQDSSFTGQLGTDQYQIANSDDTNAIVIQDVYANWTTNQIGQQSTLKGINLCVPKGKLCAIIGPVGAGKSSIMHLLLGELPIDSGSIRINGKLSYAAQEAWLFSGTVRNNILFGEEFIRSRYNDVTKRCALSTDFAQWTHADNVIVGERGASLSGGQRARISLARAVYKQAGIYLYDDPLSAVDAHVGRKLFDELIGPKSHLARENATRILITHQVHFLAEADWIVIMENGQITNQGTYNELRVSKLDFAKVLNNNKLRKDSSEDVDDENINEDNNSSAIRKPGFGKDYLPLRRSSSEDSHPIRKSVSVDHDEEDKEQMEEVDAEDYAKGGIKARTWWKYLHAGSSVIGLFFLVLVMLLSQILCSGSDYFANVWTQQEFLRLHNQTNVLTSNECIYIYGALIISVIVMTIFRGVLFFKMCMHASKVLHDRMFQSILGAKMQFFDVNPSGRILNRFSKDMGAIDELLPKALMDFIQVALVMIGILIVICIMNPILLLATFVVAIADICILKVYLRPAQELKRLEGIYRSPVFSHVSATLSGLVTIRSRNLSNVVVNEFDDLQDNHSAIWQLTMCCNTALGLWLDCVSCCFLTLVTFSFIIFNEDTFNGNVGLAISQSMILTGMVQYGVRQVAESLQQMTSVERVLEYTNIEQESEESRKPPDIWPTEGRIEFRNVYCSYTPTAAPILKDINFVVEPGWKVGVVGRTGAGKSSLIGTLFRLMYIKGEILIDDLNTELISLAALRSRISIIPQDPVLFSATIRYNLDPFDMYSDEELWQALESVELKKAITHLDLLVTQHGSNFSVGQRQLICLARAILRNNKILVLDEATANVDPLTDNLIQKTIRMKFEHCTVLTIAHRLHTIMDSDRILVLEAGILQEYDLPYNLLQMPNGCFKRMVDTLGSDAKALRQIALHQQHHTT